MSNLHDISWGNRPSVTAGTHMLSNDQKKQQELKSNYMVFRVNFMTVWLVMNAAFAMLMINQTKVPGTGDWVINNGEMGFVEIFALYLAALVIYKVFFGGLHILRFKIMRNFVAKYKTPKYDLKEEVKRLRIESPDWNESLVDDDQQIYEYSRVLHYEENVDAEDELLLSSHHQADTTRTKS
mmetsp:Transcript_9471/g.14523  ORF Transcript_9471/g.14523 Transcript_9471/m.14523 type:complete len:182 (+) Transcript_9471:1881-2426(+)